MEKCRACGNEYDKPIRVTWKDEDFIFDSFQCAIHTLAPTCAHCDIKVIGHGVEAGEQIFCCANCAESEGIRELKDRAHSTSSVETPA